MAVLGCFVKTTAVAVFLVAVFLGVGLQFLANNPDFRHKFFAGFCYQIGVAHANPAFEQVRCDLLADAKGPLAVEIGPGPGTNFGCLKNNKHIKKWIGIEPNLHMQSYLEDLAKKLNVPFEIDLRTIPGESLPLETASADVVIGTHLLCSVHNATQVLREIVRILKPGGKYFFLEHVSAPQGTLKRSFQDTIEPSWTIFGDGCKFEETWVELDQLKDVLDVKYEHIEAPFPLFLSFVSPHIIGVATKK
eukprot:TRINITY_DN2217_c0_g1_i1.p1 TRINITY_DN2217_c0_g1~~TRINITY_DN2217_c0_g1_i1.p1  ORF type:complete len:248 (+),score=60.84 TRINITY_DN2217_c0_g1_i1:57-800(+)